MKIGILTYHRSHNYGALLQAIALRKVISEMGHEVSFIDYWPHYHKHTYALFSLAALYRDGISNGIRYLKNSIFHYRSRLRRIRQFKNFIRTNIEPYCSTLDECYDVIIYGSDQIWRKQPELGTYNPMYFGEHKITSKRNISYAASMGSLPDNKMDICIIRDFLKNLDHIGVREQNLKQFVEGLGYNVSLDADPTLLMNGDEWKKYLQINKNIRDERYLLYYCLLPNAFRLEDIKAYAKIHNWKLVIVYGHATKSPSESHIIDADPRIFLSLILHAECVVTSSFHGLVFSILFHKQFYVSFSRDAARAESLLSILGLSDRLLPTCSPITDFCKKIDYSVIDELLSTYRQKSICHLMNIIKNNYH